MNDYVIYTDSACDLSPKTLAEWGVPYSCLSFKLDNADSVYFDHEMDSHNFYTQMREGSTAKTFALNAAAFRIEFEDILQQGKDILHISFSSALSATYYGACVAARELSAEYPERKIIVVDSLSGSVGQGLLIYLTLKQKHKGATLEEAAAYAERLKKYICHWVTVESPVYLKRGGRISPTVALVGNMLGFKPMLTVNDEGHLVSQAGVRGRKKAIAALVEKYGEYARKTENGLVFISHADCKEEAEEVARQLKETYGATVKLISSIGPVIGSHAGPGAIAICFVGKFRA